ncbi:MAG: glycosyltransferase family 4 protein [Candidatus Latescibacteria bacterium]|nr:glycosyltransferase family 4 protein [Candidatus Latescibacterota bacterium]
METRSRLHLLAVNWRDIKNPEAGGAEVHLHEILARMVARGHAVTLVATGFPGSVTEEVVDGIRVLRGGSWWNANFVLPRIARRALRARDVDLVVEDINKIPFLMPLYTRAPVAAVIPHLFGTTVFRETNPLFAAYVLAWEALIPLVYRASRFVAISPSTRDDLVRRGIARERIDVVLCGLDHARYRLLPGASRAEAPTVVHLGRLRKYKAVDVVLEAFARVLRDVPGARLVVVGDGPELAALRAHARRLGLGDTAAFTGRAGAHEVVAILNGAHVCANASPKEGWGLTVVEANACGVPVVGSDRPGLRDSIRDGETGFLVPYGDAGAFAHKITALLTDPALRRRMSEAARAWAQSLTWEKTAAEMEAIFVKAAGK